MSELRYHPFLGQWVITATHRQDRTFFPPDDYCPLCPTKAGGFPTEIPFEEYDIIVFENKFPSLRTPSSEIAVRSLSVGPVLPSDGVCEVVCYTSNHHITFAELELSQVKKLTRVWRDRYCSLSDRSEVQYVFIFENKGREIGVTLSHPHGQIYAYPFIPPIPLTELQNEREYLNRTGKHLTADWLCDEALGERVVCENDHFVALIPFFARYPFETYVVAKTHLSSLRQMTSIELDSLAQILLIVTRKFDGVFGFSMPYMMVMHQEPAVAGYEQAWFHVEFYPPYRTANKLKYLAGSEAGAGAYINDTLPEVSAATLRSIQVGI